jgi:hypothetical protein
MHYLNVHSSCCARLTTHNSEFNACENGRFCLYLMMNISIIHEPERGLA